MTSSFQRNNDEKNEQQT